MPLVINCTTDKAGDDGFKFCKIFSSISLSHIDSHISTFHTVDAIYELFQRSKKEAKILMVPRLGIAD